jgi:hypothetical protein
MAQSSPHLPESPSDDFESYRRFREITLSLMPLDERGIVFEQSGLARIREALSATAAQRRRLQAGYISLLAHLGQPEHLRYAPQALAGISLLKVDDLDTAQRVFDEIQERVIKPSPLFYLIRGASIFVLFLSLALLLFPALSMGPGGIGSINGDGIRTFVGFVAVAWVDLLI